MQLEQQRYGLGRSSTNDLSFPTDPLLSRHHLDFERSGDDWVVRDLGSQNGTRVNGVLALEPVRLAHGDRIVAGHLVILYRTRDGAVDISPKQITFVGHNPVAPSSTIVVNLQSALQAGPGVTDRTTRESSHFQALMRAGRELAGVGALDKLYEVALDLALQSVNASRGVVMTTGATGELTPRALRGDDLQISTVVRDLVMKQAKSLLVHDALWDRTLASQPSILAQEVRSILAVPLQTDDRVLGLLYLDSPHFVREFTTEDLNLITVIANMAAIRIEHARLSNQEQAQKLFEQDLERAAEIQRRLLPSDVPVIRGFDCAGYNAPCRMVGGDYYDFLPDPEGRMAALIGDVSGKGLGAALLMSSLQARAQVIFEERESLREQVTRLNKSIAVSCPPNCFITFFVALLDPESETLTYCNAGHNAPVLLRRDGEFELLEATGLPLGISRQAFYEQKSCRMNEGDMLVLFSDGITEACGEDPDQEFGQDRLIASMRRLQQLPAPGVIKEIREELLTFTGGVAADDMTLVVVRRSR